MVSSSQAKIWLALLLLLCFISLGDFKDYRRYDGYQEERDAPLQKWPTRTRPTSGFNQYQSPKKQFGLGQQRRFNKSPKRKHFFNSEENEDAPAEDSMIHQDGKQQSKHEDYMTTTKPPSRTESDSEADTNNSPAPNHEPDTTRRPSNKTDTTQASSNKTDSSDSPANDDDHDHDDGTGTTTEKKGHRLPDVSLTFNYEAASNNHRKSNSDTRNSTSTRAPASTQAPSSMSTNKPVTPTSTNKPSPKPTSKPNTKKPENRPMKPRPTRKPAKPRRKPPKKSKKGKRGRSQHDSYSSDQLSDRPYGSSFNDNPISRNSPPFDANLILKMYPGSRFVDPPKWYTSLWLDRMADQDTGYWVNNAILVDKTKDMLFYIMPLEIERIYETSELGQQDLPPITTMLNSSRLQIPSTMNLDGSRFPRNMLLSSSPKLVGRLGTSVFGLYSQVKGPQYESMLPMMETDLRSTHRYCHSLRYINVYTPRRYGIEEKKFRFMNLTLTVGPSRKFGELELATSDSKNSPTYMNYQLGSPVVCDGKLVYLLATTIDSQFEELVYMVPMAYLLKQKEKLLENQQLRHLSHYRRIRY